MRRWMRGCAVRFTENYMQQNNMVTITLKKGKQESLLRRHPWIFSGAIHSASGEVEEGSLVDVHTSDGQFIARGHSAIGSIAIRVLTFDENQAIDQQWWNSMINKALDVRRALGLVDNQATNCYRLVHGEGDSLPGLVVDVYGSVAVVQAHSLGMYLAMDQIVEALKTVFGDKLSAIYGKSGSTLPSASGVVATDGYLYHAQEVVRQQVVEGGFKFNTNWEDGQKTGFFLDQRLNRELVAYYSKGRRVLNTFCYTGGFSVYALGAGAEFCDSVDSSARAVELAVENVSLNFSADIVAKHKAITADAIDFVKQMERGKYDLIVLDPPAFAKNHKVLGNALQGYKRLNARAMENIAPGGILFTFSCSQAVSKEQFRTAVFSAAAIAGRNVRILHQLTQPADHPINIYHPEGEYLKGLVLYVE